MLVADFFNAEKFKNVAHKNLVLYKADYPRNKDLVTAIKKRKMKS